MKKSCIIVASGVGKRFGGNVPKQYTIINQKEVWYYSVNAFIKRCDEVIIVVHADYLAEVTKKSEEYFKEDFYKISVVEGGKERYNSVYNGLLAIKDKNSFVAVHDSVRALVSKKVIDGAFEVANSNGNAVVYAPVVDTIKFNDNGKYNLIDRDKLLSIQTPQIFKACDLMNAIEKGIKENFNGTDDSSFMEKYYGKIFYFEGEKSNIKLTTKEDLDYFTFYINRYLL